MKGCTYFKCWEDGSFLFLLFFPFSSPFLILCLSLFLLHQSSSSDLVQPVSCVRM